MFKNSATRWIGPSSNNWGIGRESMEPSCPGRRRARGGAAAVSRSASGNSLPVSHGRPRSQCGCESVHLPFALPCSLVVPYQSRRSAWLALHLLTIFRFLMSLCMCGPAGRSGAQRKILGAPASHFSFEVVGVLPAVAVPAGRPTAEQETWLRASVWIRTD